MRTPPQNYNTTHHSPAPRTKIGDHAVKGAAVGPAVASVGPQVRLGLEQDVAGREVAVHEAARRVVQVLESRGRVHGRGQDPVLRELWSRERGE